MSPDSQAGAEPASRVVGYGALLRVSRAKSLMALGLFARLPLGMTALALLATVTSQRGSILDAALVSGANGLGVGLSVRVQGRFLDRFGITRVAVAGSGVSAGLLAGILLSAQSAPLFVLVAASAGAGFARPQMTSFTRAVWSSLGLDEGLKVSAARWEALTLSIVATVGPLLVAAATATVGVSFALGATAVLAFVGPIGFALLPAARQWRSRRRQRQSAPVIAQSAAFRNLLTGITGSSIASGIVFVALVAKVREQGAGAAAGILLAGFAFGGVAGLLVFGSARHWKMDLDKMLTRWLILEALGFAVLGFPDSLPQVAGVALIAGFSGALVVACTYQLAARCAPDNAYSETFAWVAQWRFVGSSAGMMLGGLAAAKFNAAGAFFIAASVAVIGELLAVARLRRTRDASRVDGAIGMDPV